MAPIAPAAVADHGLVVAVEWLALEVPRLADAVSKNHVPSEGGEGLQTPFKDLTSQRIEGDIDAWGSFVWRERLFEGVFVEEGLLCA